MGPIMLRLLSPALLAVIVSATALTIGCAEPSDATPSSDNAVKNGVTLKELPAKSSLRQKVEEQNSTWGDENIMNGNVSVAARKVSLDAVEHLDVVAKAAFEDRLKWHGEYVGADEVQGKVTTAVPKDAAVEAAKRLALDGFVYANNRDNIAPVEEAVKSLVDALGPAADVQVMRADAKVVVPSADDDAKTWRASTYVFANKRTGELVVFYAREGWT